MRFACSALFTWLGLTGLAAAQSPTRLTLRFDEGVYEHKGRKLPTSAIKASASSVMCEKDGSCHKPELALDGKPATAWCEGAEGSGVGQSLSLSFSKPVQLTSFLILPFYAKSKAAMFGNARVKELEHRTDGGTYLVEFPDQSPSSAFNPDAQLPYRHPIVDFTTDPAVRKAVATSKLELTVKAVYPGSRFQDLCISELQLHAR